MSYPRDIYGSFTIHILIEKGVYVQKRGTKVKTIYMAIEGSIINDNKDAGLKRAQQGDNLSILNLHTFITFKHCLKQKGESPGTITNQSISVRYIKNGFPNIGEFVIRNANSKHFGHNVAHSKEKYYYAHVKYSFFVKVLLF